jgi:glycosyltransferase involved in cell wall biosynthesis
MAIQRSTLPAQGIHVFYGYDHLPTALEVAQGGIIKFQRLSETFPNTPRSFNVIYMVSSDHPRYAAQLVRAALHKGAKFVWNQDGVAYPAWMPSGWEAVNARLAQLLHAAHYVLYQSDFSRLSSDRFLGERSGPWEVLHNAVDTDLFRPATSKKAADDLVLLTAGSKYLFERLESPIRALACVRKRRPRARLLFAGRVSPGLMRPAQRLIAELRLEGGVTFLPPFTQADAPSIFQQADILLHPKINDPCPGVVIEAMACGLPVVHSDSGGVPELVGNEAGRGVATEANWERFTPPTPELWAEAVLAVAEDLSRGAEAARQRAVDRFDLHPWVERHRQLFTELLG